MPKRSTLEEFIAKARTVHGDKYDYSKVVYTNNRTKICIICPEHGEFWQAPDKHILKRGCPVCGVVSVHDQQRSSVEEFVIKAKKVHGDKYDYSKVEYQGNKVKVCITCPEHGDFWQVPNSHLSGRGCPVCGRIQANKSESYSNTVFMTKAKVKHGDKYDYSLVEYTNSQNKVKIICSVHGVFEQTPARHLFGNGCPKCAKEYTKNALSNTLEDFLTKVRKVHGNKYNYSDVVYTNNRTKIKIICPKHGVFEQAPDKHLSGRGCPKCGLDASASKRRIKWDVYRSKLLSVHNGKYDYSLVEYFDSQTKIKIICPKHGVFEQIPSNHLQGQGCPQCAIERLSIELRDTLEDFIVKAREAHGDKYDYSKVEYSGNKTPVEIICPEHGSFMQIPNSHTRGCGCPKCVHHISKGEQEMMDWVKQYSPDACHTTKVLAGKDIDIYIPSKKLGIEYNGIYYHSLQFRAKYDHSRKLETAQQLGIRLMQFWDFEWENKKDIVKSIILNALGVHSERVFARNTEIEEITSRQARTFCEENHIHGFRAANKYLGLAQNGVLLAMMSWNTDGEMVRFVVKNGHSVLGAFSKLLKHSSVTYSFVDRRIFTGAGYLKNGFVLQRITQPNYFYENSGQYAGSRQTYQKHKLSKLLPIFDSSLTEMQNMANNDYYPVYDCGNLMLVRREESTGN